MTRTRLLICRACPGRDRPGTARRAALGPGAGTRLAGRLRPLLPRDVGLLLVECLSGCRSPCNAQLVPETGPALRLHRLGPDDAAALAAFCATPALPRESWPEALRGKLAAILPSGPAPA